MKKNISAVLTTLLLGIIFISTAAAQTVTNSNKDGKKNEKQIKDKPLEILKKPPATGSHSCPAGLSIVRIKVTFDSSGKVTNAEILESSNCKDFDNNAVKAAKKIKFKPAVKDGEAVTVVKTVEYQFHLYDKI